MQNLIFWKSVLFYNKLDSHLCHLCPPCFSLSQSANFKLIVVGWNASIVFSNLVVLSLVGIRIVDKSCQEIGTSIYIIREVFAIF